MTAQQALDHPFFTTQLPPPAPKASSNKEPRGTPPATTAAAAGAGAGSGADP